MRETWLRVLVAGVLAAVVIARAFFPTVVSLDATTLAALAALVIVVVLPQLSSASLPGGAEIRFRDRVSAAEGLADDLQADGQRKARMRLRRFPPLVDTEALRSMVGSRPADALAHVRSELAGNLQLAASRMVPSRACPDDPLEALELLAAEGCLRGRQEALIRIVLDLTGDLPMQGDVSPVDAQRVLAVADVLNDSFPLGYSINFQPNDNWKRAGLLCKFEHCIENMDTGGLSRAEEEEYRARIQAALDEGFYDADSKRKTYFTRMLAEPIDPDLPDTVDRSGACPIWGHFCPAGAQYVQRCKPAKAWMRA